MEENIIEQPNLEPENNSINQEGSIFGKFKDAETLLEAYNSLQAEFTRKSQKLADIQKKNEEIALLKSNDNIENILKDVNDVEKYKKEITEILSNNYELNNLPNKHQIAFKIIQESERKTAENLNNQDFMNTYILNNQDITNRIIKNYVSNLNNISTPPNVYSGNPANIHFSPNNTPKTLKEAGEIFSKMLK